MPRILVMDDTQMIRSMVNAILTRDGHTVVEAGGWTDGTERICTESFDLIITDLLMPSPGSLQFIRTKRENYPHLPLIVMSGVADPAHYGGVAESLGATGALSKPFSRDDLLDAVNEALAHEAVPNA